MAGYVCEYDRVAPCSRCPFGRGDGAVRLSPERAEEIVSLAGRFSCRKPTGEEMVPTDESPVCAGSILFRLNSGNPPLSVRLAVAMGVLDLEKYQDPALLRCVVDGVDDMVIGGVR